MTCLVILMAVLLLLLWPLAFSDHHTNERHLAFIFSSEGSSMVHLCESHAFTSNSNVQPEQSVKYTYEEKFFKINTLVMLSTEPILFCYEHIKHSCEK